MRLLDSLESQCSSTAQVHQSASSYPVVPSVVLASPQRFLPLSISPTPSCCVQVEQFRQCAAYEAFMKKWSLPVFFSLQFQVQW